MPPPPLIPQIKDKDVEEYVREIVDDTLDSNYNKLDEQDTDSNRPYCAPIIKDHEIKSVMICDYMVTSKGLDSYTRIIASMANEKKTIKFNFNKSLSFHKTFNNNLMNSLF